ncbi:MAG: hypothetical protein BM556_05445 [Bacteriovorax sp. MedPE-SWde]|nr:MAG: hypothetical protein BM556_05445 [Bacteriovorax sp. MedPE-SWde]
MIVTILEKDSHAVIEVDGALTIETAIDLKTKALKLKKVYSTLIIDLLGVEFIDSSGIGALALINNKYKAKDGQMILTNINEDISLVFSITRAYDIFDFYDSVENAEEQLAV